MTQTSDSHSEGWRSPCLDRCPECGYLLTGLPEEGLCPECGFAYNADMIVLYGWGFGHRATLANRRWTASRMGCILFPAGLLTSGVIWLYMDAMKMAFSSRQVLLLLVPLFLPMLAPTAMMVIGVILGIWRRRELSSEGLPPVQVRLFRDGFAQREGFGPATIKRWWRWRVRFDPLDRSARECRYWCRVQAPKLWRLPMVSNPVDVEVRCDCQTADQIRRQLNEWGVLEPRLTEMRI